MHVQKPFKCNFTENGKKWIRREFVKLARKASVSCLTVLLKLDCFIKRYLLEKVWQTITFYHNVIFKKMIGRMLSPALNLNISLRFLMILWKNINIKGDFIDHANIPPYTQVSCLSKVGLYR